METKELKITIPKNHEIDWQESAKQEKIVFKKKDTKPRSWEEYCKNHKGDYYFISSYEGGRIKGLTFPPNKLVELDPKYSKHTLPSKELAEAFLAMMQLMSLRQAWIHRWSLERGLAKDWEPNWKNDNEIKYCVCQSESIIILYAFYTSNHTLSFPTKEMATDFMNCFKDLLEIAKPLI